jgi:hypothetical protein
LIPGSLFACNFFVTRVILLPPHLETKSMPVCDGCGAQVDDAHIRARIERLEMATRYRPIHIQVLLLDAEPPERVEDFFYRPAGDPAERSGAARAYYDALLRCTGEDPSRFSSEVDALAEFQRRGLFLTNVVECFAGSGLDAAVERFAPSLLKRIQFSYKPKFVAAISPALQGILPLLQQSDWADRLILNGAVPFDARSSSVHGPADLAAAVNEKLTKAVSNSA